MKKTFIYLSFIIFLGWFPSLFAGEIYVSLQGNDKNYGAQNETYIEGWEKKTSNLLIYKRMRKV